MPARFVNKRIKCELNGNRVKIEEMPGGDEGKASKGLFESMAGALGGMKIDLPAPTKFSCWALAEKDIDPDMKQRIHGAKTLNIVKSRRTLPVYIYIYIYTHTHTHTHTHI